MIENLLKLGRRFRVPVLCNQSLAAHIGRVQTAKIKMIEVEAIRRQLIRRAISSRSTLSAGFPRPSAATARRTGTYVNFTKYLPGGASLNHWRAPRIERVSRERQRKARRVFDIATLGKFERSPSLPFSFGSIPADGLPYRSCGPVTCCRLTFPLLQREIHGAVR